MQLEEHATTVFTALGRRELELAAVVASLDTLQYKRKLNAVVLTQLVALLPNTVSAELAAGVVRALLDKGKLQSDDVREVSVTSLTVAASQP